MFSTLTKALITWISLLYLFSVVTFISGYIPPILADQALTFIFEKKILSIGERPLTLFFNPGGSVKAFDATIKALEITNTSFQLAGPCYSACTFFTKLADRSNVCATPNAMLYFHRARYFPGMDLNQRPILENDEDTAKTINHFYPPKVQEWIKKKGGLPTDPDAWLQVSAMEFFKPCKATLEELQKEVDRLKKEEKLK